MTYASPAGADGGNPIPLWTGVLAGLVTLTMAGAAAWFLFPRSGDSAEADVRPTGPVPVGQLLVGDCLAAGGPIAAVTVFTPVECGTPHLAQVSAKLPHPDAGGSYPGAEAFKIFAADQCESVSGDYIGVDLLDTNLRALTRFPTFDQWADGDDDVTCLIEAVDTSPLTGAAAGRGTEFPRPDEIRVARLKPGDCFEPLQEASVYDLTSDNTIRLVGCEGDYNGLFFARATLPEPPGADFPGDAEVGDAANSLCSSRFSEFFGVPSSGFNYRYWRPNEVGWNADDRMVLCSILENDLMSGQFDPGGYSSFYDMGPGDCFNLGPGETPNSLRLDDKVLPVECGSLHVGQMLGSGQLSSDDGEQFPGDDGVQSLAGAECERLFVDFVGLSPFESELGEFPFWYPSEAGWAEGDRRYGCAFLDVEPRSGSLENTAG